MGWGAVLRGDAKDIEDCQFVLKRPFDPWVEVHGSSKYHPSFCGSRLAQYAKSCVANLIGGSRYSPLGTFFL
jgi:hypothetical protein